MRVHGEGGASRTGEFQKAAISAGALHPVDLLLLSGTDITEPLLYEESSDQVLKLEVKDPLALEAAVVAARSVVPEASGHVMLVVGDRARVASCYDAPESLLWRDAGAVLQHLSMNAYACGLAFVPLGLLGRDALEAIVGKDSVWCALGLGIIGRTAQ